MNAGGDWRSARRYAWAVVVAMATLCVSVSTAGAAESARTPAQIAAAAAPGVVGIVSTYTVESRYGTQEAVAGGSGFVLDGQGRILTNEHVIDGASKIHVTFADGTKVHATLLAADPLLDLAVLKVSVPAKTLHPLRLGSSDSLALGDPVVAIGNPFGLDRSLSLGIVSGLRRQVVAPNGFTLANAVQTDAAVNHGNSGGPLLDGKGRVIGVTAQIANSGVNANVGVAFAVAIDASVRKAILQLMAGRTVQHPWLGVSLDEIDAILATSGRVPVTSGVLITGIVPGGPGEAAGLRGGSSIAAIDGVNYCVGGDIVTRVGSRKVTTSGELGMALSAYAPGTAVKLTVVRDGGAPATLTVTLGVQPTTAPETTTGCG